MLEVCSTSLPQYVLPEIYESKEYKDSLFERIEKYKKRADIAEEILGGLKELTFVKPKGAFYLSLVFNKKNLNLSHKPKIQEKEIENYINEITT